MRRFFLADLSVAAGDLIRLPPDLLRHLQTVLRLSAGEEILLFDGCGAEAHAQLQQDSRAKVLNVERFAAAALSLQLIQGIAKGEKLELVLQKGTELGVSQFDLTQMERSIGRLKVERQEKRLLRWQKIVQEAARQCRQPWLPSLNLRSSFAETVASCSAECKLLLWEQGAQPLTELLPEQPPTSIAVVVGPEGGISAAEAEIACAAGFQPVLLGPRILRTETAGLAIMSILQYLYGDLADIHPASRAICNGKDRL